MRAAPDWPTFDIEDTRPFLRNLDLDEELIIRFANRWNAQSHLSYLEYRQAVKQIALDTVKAVRSAQLVSYRDLPGIELADDDLLYLTDDDDWVSPDLFDRLRLQPTTDGYRWISVGVGKFFVDRPESEANAPVVWVRADTDFLYTNNYVVTGQAWKRLGEGVLREHGIAQRALEAKQFSPRPISATLSAANKHLCCTTAILCNSQSEKFLSSIDQVLESVAKELLAFEAKDGLAWMADSIRRLANVNRQAADVRSASDGPE